MFSLLLKELIFEFYSVLLQSLRGKRLHKNIMAVSKQSITIHSKNFIGSNEDLDGIDIMADARHGFAKECQR